MLEVSNLDVASTKKYMEEATSLHFDCVQARRPLFPRTLAAGPVEIVCSTPCLDVPILLPLC